MGNTGVSDTVNLREEGSRGEPGGQEERAEVLAGLQPFLVDHHVLSHGSQTLRNLCQVSRSPSAVKFYGQDLLHEPSEQR